MKNAKEIKIASITISKDTQPLVVPEIGINHNGSLELAKLMVDSAARAGAKLIKHQTHIVEDEMSEAAKSVIPGNAKISIYEIMQKCALNEKDERALKEYSESKGLVYLSTPFSRAAANRLEDMGVLAYKIGSGECNNYPLIKHIASFKKPMILSTGMNSLANIKESVAILRKAEVPFVLLHTTNLYPTPQKLVRLNAMKKLEKEFDCLVGLSDHTLNNLACLGAIALGACVLERHFTDTMHREGPDIVCSMDEHTLKELIIQSEQMRIMRGDGALKQAATEEQVTIDFAFASVVSIKDIKKGELLSKENIWVKRPGKGGIHAKHYESILGKKAKKDIAHDTQLQFEDFE
ncbi:N-acetylneuraminate synthase [Campylobacter sp. MIT 12-5580]|uniref:N-acetylneuraminate synthase n=1 Tax=Campylobacter sp. MIT 12-5580 TaxID=2040651 RepID=UPI0010F71235|nr:N-acetylneuraminate synthase [Campylobacter sp. MIT 12-5580]TKX28202.1 N-acetylneuraminate synthase [Campylobacter sp. MIT 12-5580]